MMRSLLLLILCLSGWQALSQNSLIVDKDGKKTIVRDDAIEVIMIDKRISYKEMGKTWEKYIRFKDLDYAIFGEHILRSFKLGGKKKDKVRFLLAEDQQKSLVGVAITITTSSSSGRISSSHTNYYIAVIDENENVLEEYNYSDSQKKEERSQLATEMIKKHFADCPGLMKRLADSGNNATSLINYPIYTNCK